MPLPALTERTSRERWRPSIPAGLILLIALVWRLLGINSTEIWRDEAITLIHARAAWSDLLFRLPWVEDTPPLNFLLFKAWSLAFRSEAAGRVLPVIFGTSAVAVMMLIARRLHPAAWWPVGLLAALAPVSLHYSQEIRVYSLLVLATALCFWQAERIIGGARRVSAYALLGVLAALAAHCHAVGLFVYPMVMVYIGCRGGWRPLRGLASWGGAPLWLLLIAPMLWFSLHWSHLHRQAGDWWIDPLDSAFARWYAGRFVGLGLISEWEAVDRLGRAWMAFALVRLVLAAVVVLISAGLTDRGTRQIVLALAGSAAAFIAMLWLSSALGLPNLVERTLLPAHIPCLLALGVGAAAGAHRLLRVAGKLGLLSLVLLFGLGWVWAVEWGPPRRDQSLAIAQWLRSQIKPGDSIISTPEWFEDMVVYRLGDCVPGEAFLTQASQVYGGSPATHQMRPRVPDPLWRERLKSAMNAHPDGTIWLFRYSWFTRYRRLSVEEVEGTLREGGYRPVEGFSMPGERGSAVTAYRR